MPKGPQGQKRPADVLANAVVVAKIATGELVEKSEIPETPTPARSESLVAGRGANRALGRSLPANGKPSRRRLLTNAGAIARIKPAFCAQETSRSCHRTRHPERSPHA